MTNFRLVSVPSLVWAVGLLALLSGARPLQGSTSVQDVARTDTLTLAELQDLAVSRDPRAIQATLDRQRRDLQIDNLELDRLPQLQLRTDAAYQSEVTNFPGTQPGVSIAQPPNDRYEATLGVQWMVWDGGRSGARGDLVESGHQVTTSTLEATLYRVRVQVSAAFFEALLLQESLNETDALIEDLEARLADVRARVAAGAALPGDTALLRAEVLRASQQQDALRADRRAVLDVLAQYTGRMVPEGASLEAPNLDQQADQLRALNSETAALPAELRVHPQFRVFEAQSAAIDREVDVQGALRMPVLQAFADLSYGSPGYELFRMDLHDYWRAGVQMQWTPWDWGRRDRDVESLRIQRQILDSEEQALAERLVRNVQRPLRAVDRLRLALETDETIIRLREQVERQSRAQFAERAIPASVYTDTRTDLAEARIDRARHRAQLARAQAEALMTLGLELR